MSTTDDEDISSRESISNGNAPRSKPEGSSASSKRKACETNSEGLDPGFETLLSLFTDPLDSEFDAVSDAFRNFPYFKKARDKFNDAIQTGMTVTPDPEVGAAVLCFSYLRWYPCEIWEWHRILNGQEESSGGDYPLLHNPAVLHAKIYSYADRRHLTGLKTIAYQRFLVAFATLNRCGADSYRAEVDSWDYNIFNQAHQFTGQDRDFMDIIFQEMMSDESLQNNRDILRVFLYGLIRFRDSSNGNSLCTWYRHKDLALLLAPARIDSIHGLCICSHNVGFLMGCEHERGCQHGCNIPCEHSKDCNVVSCYAYARRTICCQFCLTVTNRS